jgi:hypothetical protein
MEEVQLEDNQPPAAQEAHAMHPTPSLPSMGEAAVMSLGLDLAGFVGRHSMPKTNNQRFCVHYGIGATAVAAMYMDLKVKGVQCNWLLMASNFQKTCMTPNVSCLVGEGSMRSCYAKASSRLSCKSKASRKRK